MPLSNPRTFSSFSHLFFHFFYSILVKSWITQVIIRGWEERRWHLHPLFSPVCLCGVLAGHHSSQSNTSNPFFPLFLSLSLSFIQSLGAGVLCADSYFLFPLNSPNESSLICLVLLLMWKLTPGCGFLISRVNVTVTSQREKRLEQKKAKKKKNRCLILLNSVEERTARSHITIYNKMQPEFCLSQTYCLFI